MGFWALTCRTVAVTRPFTLLATTEPDTLVNWTSPLTLLISSSPSTPSTSMLPPFTRLSWRFVRLGT